MGRALSADTDTEASDTQARLQSATRAGLPVLIPGAFESRARGVPTDIIADPAAAAARAAIVMDRLRLGRAPDGAVPDDRRSGHARNFVARLWRRLLRGPGMDMRRRGDQHKQSLIRQDVR